jgi:2-iminobutanoate/2-iminopropanoate deaminase
MIAKKELVPVKIPDALARVGPFSQAIKVGNLLFIAGQGPLDIETGEVVHTTIEEQTHLAFQNVKRALTAAGTSLDNLVRLTIFLTDFKDYDAMNKVRLQYVGRIPPVSSTVQVAYLYQGIKIEIEATAVVPEEE